jgi:hypothetical protein
LYSNETLDKEDFFFTEVLKSMHWGFAFFSTLTNEETLDFLNTLKSTVSTFKINSVDFDKIRITISNSRVGIIFKNCCFENLNFFSVENTVWLQFDSCYFYGDNNFIKLFKSNGSIEFNDCIVDGLLDFNFVENDPINLIINNTQISRCKFENNKFSSFVISNTSVTDTINSKPLNVWSNKNYCDFFELKNLIFSNLRLTNWDVNENIIINNLNIRNSVCLSKFNFKPDMFNADWESFSSKRISIPKTVRYIDYFKTAEELVDTYFGVINLDSIKTGKYNSHANDLMALYNKLYNSFKVRGDKISANACYIEMKELETVLLEQQYKKDMKLKSWFYHKLNLFLFYFCDYGTSPVKALMRSMWTILGFALIYFFVYSEWDKISRSFLIERHKKLLQYFRSEITLKDLYNEKYLEEYEKYEKYRLELSDSQSEVPRFIHIMGKPLYYLSLLRHDLISRAYSKLEIMQGRWIELPDRRRWNVGFIIGITVLFYIIYLIVYRALNALMLSVNVFSTLGFGDIPVGGFTRYLAILEGFFGWFLLSIFSVSLISQLIQL